MTADRWTAVTVNYYEHPRFGAVKFDTETRKWWAYPSADGWRPQGPLDTYEQATEAAKFGAKLERL